MLRIVSGGQTGVDRAALDVALTLGLPCGGFCPRGRRAEDGPIAPEYPLVETPTDDYAERTLRNVRSTDATLLLVDGAMDPGTRLTAELAVTECRRAPRGAQRRGPSGELRPRHLPACGRVVARRPGRARATRGVAMKGWFAARPGYGDARHPARGSLQAMPVIQVEARLSTDQLLEAADQMSAEELATFTRRVLELRARRAAPVLFEDESPLLERINRGLPAARHARYATLLGRRDAGTLTEAEHDELLALSDEQEALDADRMEALSELARLRRVSLAQAMTSLGLGSAAR